MICASFCSKNVKYVCYMGIGTPRIKMGTLSSSTSSGAYHYRSASSSNANREVWVDGPRWRPTNRRTKVDLDNEVWIDGPRAVRASVEQTPAVSGTYRTGFPSVESAFGKDITESLERIDRELLNQLNRHDANARDTLDSPHSNQSRPISLLSVNSTTSAATTTHVSTSSTLSADSSSASECTRRKLDDLKSSCQLGGSIFAQTLEPMDALHRTLESILSLDQEQHIRPTSSSTPSPPIPLSSTFQMSRVKSTVLSPVGELFGASSNDETVASAGRFGMIESYLRDQTATNDALETSLRLSDDDRRLSRILSPTQFKHSESALNPLASATQSVQSNEPQVTNVKPTSPSGKQSL